jgi:quercetin dioxygenase-like cupin family protein
VVATHYRKVAYQDVPPNRKRGGDLRALLTPTTVGASTGFLGAATLEPGESISEHYHPYSEEFLYLVRGQLSISLDGIALEVSAGEALLIPKYSRHRLQNDAAEPAYVVFCLSPLAPRPELGHVDTETPPGETTPAAAPAAGGGDE